MAATFPRPLPVPHIAPSQGTHSWRSWGFPATSHPWHLSFYVTAGASGGSLIIARIAALSPSHYAIISHRQSNNNFALPSCDLTVLILAKID